MRELVFPGAYCRVGVARCDITPPVGIYHRMWGAATHDRATGVHQPLTATALVLASPLSPDAPPQVILAIDHCLFWGPVIESMLSRLEKATKLPRSSFAITFSHTHAAGLMDPERIDLPGGELIGAYLDKLGGQLVEITIEALGKLRPAWINFTTGRCALAAQRDFWDEVSKQYVCGFNPDGPGDDTVVVGRITAATGGEGERGRKGERERGELIATVVNYACHPTTLAFQNTLISPDYPGATRQVVEQATGAPCIFLQGASGDLGPREGYVGDVRVAERNGRQLGYAVLAALEGMPPAGSRYVYQGPVVSGATLGLWEYQQTTEEQKGWQSFSWKHLTIPLPYRSDLPSLDKLRRDMELWTQKEKAAQAAADAAGYRDAHAMVERLRRLATRLGQLPGGAEFPLPVILGRLGDSLWLFVEGEHYHWLQESLRQRVSPSPLFVVTLTNGWRCSYLPRAEAYGKGIYQETIAVLAKGALETLEARIGPELVDLAETAGILN